MNENQEKALDLIVDLLRYPGALQDRASRGVLTAFVRQVQHDAYVEGAAMAEQSGFERATELNPYAEGFTE